MVDALEENVMKDILSMGLKKGRKVMRWAVEHHRWNDPKLRKSSAVAGWFPITEYVLEQSYKHWFSTESPSDVDIQTPKHEISKEKKKSAFLNNSKLKGQQLQHVLWEPQNMTKENHPGADDSW